MEVTQKQWDELINQIDKLPQKLLDTRIHIKRNGTINSELTLCDAIKESYIKSILLESNVKIIMEGKQKIPVRDIDGFISDMELKEIIEKLNSRPKNKWNRIVGTGSGILTLLLLTGSIFNIIGMIALIIYFTTGSLMGK
ncbi:MAG: hypothetical protein WC346_06410 [Methanogenium sp.]|jgi:hypothetical protein